MELIEQVPIATGNDESEPAPTDPPDPMPNGKKSITQRIKELRPKRQGDDNSEPFPDLDNFDYSIATPPAGSQLTAWAKFKECERRLAVYKWAEARNDPGPAQNRVMLDDSVSAFLLTFEATLQFVKDQFPRPTSAPNFDDWLKGLPEHDLIVRGLRTLRRFQAHVETKKTPSVIRASLGGEPTPVSRTWHLPRLDLLELAKVRSVLKDEEDLNDWNRAVAEDDVSTLFQKGLEKLKAILEAAERRIYEIL